MVGALERQGISESVYLWSDDNLSNDYFFSYLTTEQRKTIERHQPYGKVCCFKGFDAASFAFNTQARESDFAQQFELMSRLVKETTLDLYAYATFTGPTSSDPAAAIPDFIDRLQQISPALPLRTVPLQVGVFTPVRGRLGNERLRAALSVQEAAIAIWNDEIRRRFNPEELSRNICDGHLRT
jgi:hypothetical protein